jgi:hypothetical protein
MADVVKIEGLRELQKALKKAEGMAPTEIRLALNEAAEFVAEKARVNVPKRSGRASASIKAQSSQRLARVKAGGAKVPYYGWLDFGGSVGRNNSVKRPFLKDGRYIYPAFYSNKDEVQAKLVTAIDALLRKAGL